MRLPMHRSTKDSPPQNPDQHKVEERATSPGRNCGPILVQGENDRNEVNDPEEQG